MTFQSQILKWIKIYVVGMLVAAGAAVAFWGYIAVNRVYDDAAVRVAQIGVMKAQEQNVGKPQIIEQRYFSPQGK